MPLLKIGDREVDVPIGKRLILAIEEAGIPILHRCGGWARCTTCRVRLLENEPRQMTEAEQKRLKQDAQPLYGYVRLACQILCEHDMPVEPPITLENALVTDPGKQPDGDITPAPFWIDWRYCSAPP